jgi:hypothetical protein
MLSSGTIRFAIRAGSPRWGGFAAGDRAGGGGCVVAGGSSIGRLSAVDQRIRTGAL